MPTYEYVCQACQHHLEVIQKMTADPLVHCDACGKDALQRVLSPGAFELKGKGWYVTDFRNKTPAAKPAASGGESTPSSTTKDSKKTD